MADPRSLGISAFVLMSLLASGCSDAPLDPAPTAPVDETSSPSPVVDPTPTPTPRVTPTPTEAETPTATATPTPTASPTATPTLPGTPTATNPPTPTPSAPPTPTEAETPTATAAPTPTATAAPTPTATAAPTPTATATVTPTPTPTPTAPTDDDRDGFDASEDCDDGDSAIFPGADERCNDIDDDCDVFVDEDPADPPTWYLDSDEDGFGRPAGAEVQCDAPSVFHTTQGGDCADLDPDIHPEADEVCNEIDDDCDGLIDDGDDDVDLTTGSLAWEDADGDGWGDEAVEVAFCVIPTGYVELPGDCDDDAPEVNPDAEDVCDGLDNDCDGESDSGDIGGAPLCAGESCFDILKQDPEAEDGVYWIDPGASGSPFQVACDMTTDGGGWTILEKSPYGNAVGVALYRDNAVNEAEPSQDKHRLSRGKMERLQATDRDLRIDCRGEDYLLTDTQNLFRGEDGPDSCDNWAVIHYREASMKGNLLLNQEMVTWMVGRAEGCAGAWHIDEHAQQGYAFQPNYPWTGEAITSSSADSFATDPSSLDTRGHECHTSGAIRHVMVRPQEVCGSGLDDDGDGQIDEGTLGLTPETAASSCQAILDACPSQWASDGRYFIDPDGIGPMEAYCDMTTEGGGWTLVGSYNNNDGAYAWTRFASGDDNLGAWRNDSAFGTLDDFETSDYKSPAFSRLRGTDLMAWDSTGGWASYKGALSGSLLSTIQGYSACSTEPLAGVTVRSSDAFVNDYGFLTFYGGDPNNGNRCAFNYQVDTTDSSVIAMAHQGCGSAGFGHLGWLNGSTHNDRDHYFCLADNSILNTSQSCGAWNGQTSNNWFDSAPCDYALLFVR